MEYINSKKPGTKRLVKKLRSDLNRVLPEDADECLLSGRQRAALEESRAEESALVQHLTVREPLVAAATVRPTETRSIIFSIILQQMNRGTHPEGQMLQY